MFVQAIHAAPPWPVPTSDTTCVGSIWDVRSNVPVHKNYLRVHASTIPAFQHPSLPPCTLLRPEKKRSWFGTGGECFQYMGGGDEGF